MRFKTQLGKSALAGMLAAASLGGGWGQGRSHWNRGYAPPPMPNGTLSSQIWRGQEHNAEASDFVIHEHEFVLGGTRLNYAGEDHVKQIAARLQTGQQFPVLVERSRHTVRATDEYKYPVHLNPVMDMARREVIVQALLAMGLPDAEQRVVVAPAYVPGYTGNEAQAAYLRGLQGNFGGGGGGFGGGFGNGGFGGGGFY